MKAVVDCFAGQAPAHGGIRFRLDQGWQQALPASPQTALALEDAPAVPDQDAAFRNADITLTTAQLKDNIQKVQRLQNLPVSTQLVSTNVCAVNLDIEMETGTGKTYCYIKTMFDLHEAYGWSKFIVVVPNLVVYQLFGQYPCLTSN